MADGGHTLVIEGLSDATLRGLEAQAAAHARSMDIEVRDVLDRYAAAAPQPDEARRQHWERLRSEAARIRAMTPQGVVQTDSTLLVREDRDSR